MLRALYTFALLAALILLVSALVQGNLFQAALAGLLVVGNGVLLWQDYQRAKNKGQDN